MKPIELIDPMECRTIRARVERAIAEGGSLSSFSFSADGIGDVDLVEATGRATCRQCGNRIAKGDQAIRGCYDFAQCGAWTAVTVQIHRVECQPAP